MLTGDENIIDIDFVVLLAHPRRRRVPVQHPQPGGHRQVGRRERDARGDRPHPDPAGADRGARPDRGPGPARHPGDHGPVPRRRGRSPRSSCRRSTRRRAVIEAFRDVQRANADRERQRNEAEAYRNDIIPRARGEAERHDAGGPGLPRQPGSPAPAARRRASSPCSPPTSRRRTSRCGACTSRRWRRSCARNPKIIVDDRLQGLVPFLNLTEQPRGRRAGASRRRRCRRPRRMPPAPRSPPRRERRDEPPRHRRRRRCVAAARRRRLVAVHRAADPAGADHPVRRAACASSASPACT